MPDTREEHVDAVITAHNVCKVFYDQRRRTCVVAVWQATFAVKRSEFVCIVGPSGCGKTTLLRILGGLEKATSGTVAVVGKSKGLGPAMVFQETSLLPWLTVEENVAFPLRVRHVAEREQCACVEPLLRVMGLLDFRAAYPHQLSGGMKQRASVARALAHDSDVLLMDEPFGALDEQTRVVLQQELLRVWDETDKTVVFITHSVDEALTLSDRVIVMSAQPGGIREVVDVPLGRPREVLALRREYLYGELVYRVWQLLDTKGSSV